MFKERKFIAIAIVVLSLVSAQWVYSHCQVPCGIYDDQMRIKMIAEHITTMEKAMKQVTELSKTKTPDYNQIVRWVVNKEKHAEDLSDIVTYYFMAQRLKPSPAGDAENYADYQKKLEVLHHILVYTMQAKQTTDLAHIEKLKELLKKFETAYFEHKHK